MKYESLKKFIISTKASKSTIYKFYKKNEDLFAETSLRNGKRMFPADHARYFDSEIMFDENKALRQENQSMRNLIDLNVWIIALKNKGMLLYGYVIMSNHIHLIVQSEDGKLSDLIRDFKKFIAMNIGIKFKTVLKAEENGCWNFLN